MHRTSFKLAIAAALVSAVGLTGCNAEEQTPGAPDTNHSAPATPTGDGGAPADDTQPSEDGSQERPGGDAKPGKDAGVEGPSVSTIAKTNDVGIASIDSSLKQAVAYHSTGKISVYESIDTKPWQLKGTFDAPESVNYEGKVKIEGWDVGDTGNATFVVTGPLSGNGSGDAIIVGHNGESWGLLSTDQTKRGMSVTPGGQHFGAYRAWFDKSNRTLVTESVWDKSDASSFATQGKMPLRKTWDKGEDDRYSATKVHTVQGEVIEPEEHGAPTSTTFVGSVQKVNGNEVTFKEVIPCEGDGCMPGETKGEGKTRTVTVGEKTATSVVVGTKTVTAPPALWLHLAGTSGEGDAPKASDFGEGTPWKSPVDGSVYATMRIHVTEDGSGNATRIDTQFMQ